MFLKGCIFSSFFYWRTTEKHICSILLSCIHKLTFPCVCVYVFIPWQRIQCWWLCGYNVYRRRKSPSLYLPSVRSHRWKGRFSRVVAAEEDLKLWWALEEWRTDKSSCGGRLMMLGKGLKSISGVNFFLFVKVSLQIYHTRSRKTAFARHYTRFEAVYLIWVVSF